MSYRRNYTGQIHYSGSVHYPASQSGGSVSYSGTEPVFITIEVDTDSFDESVAHCNKTVGGLTAAIAATGTAQVASKRQATARIAASIIRGFFEYVGADLSQKIKELASKCESLFTALLGHKEDCVTKQRQMEEDYNRITKRYTKIFEDLDKEAVSRIETLDKPTFRFADTAQKEIDRTFDKELLGLSTISADENIRLEAVLASSRIKSQANELLDKTHDYLQGTYKLANTVNGMLDDNPGTACFWLPVMYVESTGELSGRETKVFGAEPGKTFGKTSDVKPDILSMFDSADIHWSKMPASDYDRILSYIHTEVQSDRVEDRIWKTMLDLLSNQPIQTIQKVTI